MTWFDRVALFVSLSVAALLRFPGIEARGRFDADQGHDMLTLLALTRDGVIPLLGPKTSVGDFHHGAFYYFLLAPAAAVSGSDPVVVTAFMALLGLGAVALTWWLGRAIGGPVAGAVAGLLLAVSPAAIEQSTFIWNPNPIAFFAALALAAAWRARSGGRREWWVVALGSAGAVVQLHVLGVVFFVPILALVLLEVRHAPPMVRPLVGGLAIVALLFLPLLAHELQTGFLETQRVLAYVRAGDEPLAASPVAAVALTVLRVVAWPLVGLVTDVPALASVLLAVTLAMAVLALRVAPSPGRWMVRWLIAILAWSALVLSFAAPSLQRVVPGLPNDHYHAFLDPIVILLIAIPAGILIERGVAAWASTPRPRPSAAVPPVAAALGVALLVGVSVLRLPSPDPDGGWPAMRDAGRRVVQSTGPGPVFLVGLPDFKLPDAVGFPIVRAGGETARLVDPMGYPDIGMPTVVACDRLFEQAIGLPCGGPAEDAYVAELAATHSDSPPPVLLDRFDAAPRTSISVYEPRAGTP